MNNAYVSSFLTDEYRPGLKKLLTLVPVNGIKPGERGWASEVARVLNTRVEPYGLTVHQQYVSDWNSNRKTLKAGLDLPATIALGIGCNFSSDLKVAHAMACLLLSGVWNPDVFPPKKLEALIAAGFVTTTNHDQLDRIEAAIARLELSLNSQPPISPQKLLAKHLQQLLEGKDYEALLTETLSASRAKRVCEIIEGVKVPLHRKEWQMLALVMAELTEDSKWTYDQIRALVATTLGKPETNGRPQVGTLLEAESP